MFKVVNGKPVCADHINASQILYNCFLTFEKEKVYNSPKLALSDLQAMMRNSEKYLDGIEYYGEYLFKFGRKEAILHENFIGYNVCNALRHQGYRNVPYFYGVSQSLAGEPCLVMEHIDGTALHQISDQEVEKSVLAQIYCILRVANEQFDFTHYDLHYLNIIVKRLSETPFYLKYHYDGKDHYVYSPGVIGVMIDFEQAYALGHGASCFISDIQICDQICRYTNKSYIHSDIIKLVCWKSRSQFNKIKDGDIENESLDKFYKIGKFFNKLIPNTIEEDFAELKTLADIEKHDYKNSSTLRYESSHKRILALIYFYFIFVSNYGFVSDTPRIREMSPEYLFRVLCNLCDMNVPEFIHHKLPEGGVVLDYKNQFTDYKEVVENYLKEFTENVSAENFRKVIDNLTNYLERIHNYQEYTGKDMSYVIEYVSRIRDQSSM